VIRFPASGTQRTPGRQLLRNPIADPSTLGVTAGAQLAIVVATLFFPAALDGFRGAVALGGAASAAILVFALGWRRGFEPVTMVVSGMLIAITAGAVSAALTLSQGEYLMSLVVWSGGSLSQQDWSVSRALALELGVGLLLAAVLVRPLALLGLGESGARSLGVSLTGLRFCVASVAVALSGVVAAAVRAVGFVGLAAPALVRASGVRSPTAVIFASPVAGALLLWLCDGVVQLVATTTSETFPTGAMTALVGGPLLLWLLPRVRAGGLSPDSEAPAAARRPTKHLLALAACLAIVAGLALCLGRTGSGWTILSGDQFRELAPLRWPRLLAAAAAGGLLALTGAVAQLFASFLLGAALMTVADLGARTATFPYELPLGLFAALAGAPYLIWLIGRK
jgi:ABC-type Fe3+-siderophore transport system permease subunit